MIDKTGWLSFGAALDGWAKELPHHLAFVDQTDRVDYESLDRSTRKVANALLASGLEPGDRIAWLGKNAALYFMLFFGAARAGMVMVPIGWRLAAAEAQYILEDTGASALFTQEEFIETATSIDGNLPELSQIMVDGATGVFPNIRDWMASGSEDALPDVDPDAGALQLYTSGTTGKPKGAVLTSRNLFSTRHTIAASDLDWANWKPEEIGLIVMPVAHIAGSGVGVISLFNGNTQIIAPEFSPDAVLDAVDEGITNFFAVPTAIQMIINHPRAKDTDFSRMKYVLYGAAPMPLELLREAINCFGCEFCQQYGMTETTGTFCYLPPDDHDPAGNARMRAAGVALPGVEIRIVDEENQVVPTGEVGEIVTRSELNMPHYWKNPDKTSEAIDADGWLHTGDAGYMDEDDYVFIHDRVKDMIISGGENVYPAEVENAIFGHEDVLEVAVIGVPDDKWGEAVKAIVVPRPGREVVPAKVINHARDQIAGFKVPKSVDVIAEMPRNASGKILRRELRAPYWEGADRQVN